MNLMSLPLITYIKAGPPLMTYITRAMLSNLMNVQWGTWKVIILTTFAVITLMLRVKEMIFRPLFLVLNIISFTVSINVMTAKVVRIITFHVPHCTFIRLGSMALVIYVISVGPTLICLINRRDIRFIVYSEYLFQFSICTALLLITLFVSCGYNHTI